MSINEWRQTLDNQRPNFETYEEFMDHAHDMLEVRGLSLEDDENEQLYYLIDTYSKHWD